MERTPDIYGARIKLMIGFTSLHPVVDELLLKRPLIFLKLVIIIPYITVNFSYLDVIILRLCFQIFQIFLLLQEKIHHIFSCHLWRSLS